MSEDRVLLCNHSGDSCQFGSKLLQRWPGSLCSSLGTARGHSSPLTMQYLSSKDHHRVSTSVMKAEVQVKRRRQALHLDRMTLEEQQVEEEGEMYVAGRFEGVFFSCFFYRLFSKPPLTQGLHFQCVCMCAVCVLANNLQLLIVKREDPWLIPYMLVSNVMFTFLAQALAIHILVWPTF